MANRDNWRLCGGTFFILISDARNPMPTHDEMYRGKKSGITEPETLLALARVVTPSIPNPSSLDDRSFRDGTLDFKSCENWGWGHFRFKDASAKKSFDDRIKNNYTKCLAAMTEFTNKYLELHSDTRKDEYLVKALLELLDADKTIPSSTEFYANKDGSTATKAEMLSSPSLCLESFLMGLWHYCIVRIKKNSIGKATYAEWCPPTESNNGRPYEAAIGENSSREVKLSYCNLSEFSDIKAEETQDEAAEPEPEIVDAIPEPDEQSAQQQNLEQTINQPKVFNFHFEQSGNGTQIGYVEHYDGKKED